MASIWWTEKDRLRSYSAAVKGTKAVVKVEIEVSEPGTLGFILEELGRIEREQEAARAARRTEAASQTAAAAARQAVKGRKAEPLMLPAPSPKLPCNRG